MGINHFWVVFVFACSSALWMALVSIGAVCPERQDDVWVHTADGVFLLIHLRILPDSTLCRLSRGIKIGYRSALGFCGLLH